MLIIKHEQMINEHLERIVDLLSRLNFGDTFLLINLSISIMYSNEYLFDNVDSGERFVYVYDCFTFKSSSLLRNIVQPNRQKKRKRTIIFIQFYSLSLFLSFYDNNLRSR